MTSSNRPSIRAYVGASGSGKGVSVEQHLKAEKPARLVVWDPQGEWASLGRVVDSLEALRQGMARPAWRLVYQPGMDLGKFPARFSAFCQLAYAAGDCTMLVEELADVTSPSYAPPAWGRCCTSGRHRGLRIIACTQSPALVDKKFLGNATYIRCFTLREAPHRQRMALALDVPLQQINALQTIELADGTGADITYYERDFRTGERGETTIKLRRKG